MITIEQVLSLINLRTVNDGLFIVDVVVKPGNNIVVLIDGDDGVSINDCVAVSRQIEFNLNRDLEDFELSVMSAGLTEPFKVLRQYQKNTGKQVEALTKEGKKISGKLLTVSPDGITIEVKTQEKVEGKKKKQSVIKVIELLFNQIKTTKQILSF